LVGCRSIGRRILARVLKMGGPGKRKKILILLLLVPTSMMRITLTPSKIVRPWSSKIC
jgi:hypothetical protein